MVKAADAVATLARLSLDQTSGVYMQPAADDATLKQMQQSACQLLGEPIPEEYVCLLRVTNGVQINNAYFKPAEHLISENLDVHRPEVIILGNAGNVAEFVFDRRDRRFHTINMGFVDERFASFKSFAELLAVVLHEQQVL